MQRRLMIVGGLAGALALLGYWVSTLHSYVYQETVGVYAGTPPPSPPPGWVETGVQPWAVALICMGLAMAWIAVSVGLLRGRSRGTAK